MGKTKSNVKGWHSEDFDLKDEILKSFITEISKSIGSAIKDMGWDLSQVVKITSMWAIINNKDAFNEKHHHGNSALSAAYYVKAEKDAGDIVFLIQDRLMFFIILYLKKLIVLMLKLIQ